ncbi:conserved hypothetical protein [Thiomonas sp. CB3]|nr:conserved hypothetical protein [Thiomonas sp. CB3]
MRKPVEAQAETGLAGLRREGFYPGFFVRARKPASASRQLARRTNAALSTQIFHGDTG